MSEVTTKLNLGSGVGVSVYVAVGSGVAVFVEVGETVTVGERVAACVSVYAGTLSGAVPQAVTRASISSIVMPTKRL